MDAKKSLRPTKVQALFMSIFAVLLLANNLFSVLVEGRSATILFWIVQALNVALLILSVRWYWRAKKSSPRRSYDT